MNKSAENLQTKLQNARAMKTYAKNLVEHFENREREIEKKDLDLRNGIRFKYSNEIFLTEKDQQLIEKDLIIAEKSEKISRLEMELANAEIELCRNAFLVTEHKQEIQTYDMKIQQLESQIKLAANLCTEQIAYLVTEKIQEMRMMELKTQQMASHIKRAAERTEQMDDKCTQTDELKYIMFSDEGLMSAKFASERKLEDNVGTETNEHNDVERNTLPTCVDEKEQFIALLQNQLQSAENELKIKAELIDKMENQLRNIEKEFLISKQLANETMIREINLLNKTELSDELKGILSNLTKDTAEIAKELQQYLSADKCLTEDAPVHTVKAETLSEYSCKFFLSGLN